MFEQFSTWPLQNLPHPEFCIVIVRHYRVSLCPFFCLANVVVVMVWHLDTQLPMQSVPFITNVVSSNPNHDELYSIKHYVLKFVSDLRQVGCFLLALRVPPPLKLTATIKLKIFERGVIHHNPNTILFITCHLLSNKLNKFHHIQLTTKVFCLSSVYSSSLVFSHHTLLLKHFQQNETKHGRGYLCEKETPMHTNEVYSHRVGTSEDAIAFSSKSVLLTKQQQKYNLQ